MLELPHGVRLAKLEEIPGPEADRSLAWDSVKRANLQPGYTVVRADDLKFSYYAEVNVDASKLWPTFRDLCTAGFGPTSTLVASEEEASPEVVVACDTNLLLSVLDQHEYQLSHDGFLQFGLIGAGSNLTEVFVTPTKHLQVWMTKIEPFRSVMQKYELAQREQLEFLDQYPRTTLRLDDLLDQRQLFSRVKLMMSGRAHRRT